MMCLKDHYVSLKIIIQEAERQREQSHVLIHFSNTVMETGSDQSQEPEIEISLRERGSGI